MGVAEGSQEAFPAPELQVGLPSSGTAPSQASSQRPSTTLTKTGGNYASSWDHAVYLEPGRQATKQNSSRSRVWPEGLQAQAFGSSTWDLGPPDYAQLEVGRFKIGDLTKLYPNS